jgi:enediyne polyketide synthase
VGCHEAAPPDLDVASFRRAVAPKVFGLRAVLAAVHPDRIKLLVTFGSIAGRAGPCDEPQHVTADDWSRELTVQFGLAYPRSRAVAVAWSVWSGPERADVTPISTDGAIATLRRILADPTVGPELLVSGRAAGLAALAGPSALPGTRFVDRVLVHYPGVELVTEADLHADTDPYLADHPSDGEPSFPMALGIEAIAQAAAALTGWRDPAVLENVEFGLPIPVPPSGSTTIRTAVLVRDTETVDAVVRSGRTGFGTDHIRARLRLPRPVVPATHPRSALLLPTVPIDPITELYGGILPQGKQFQRLLGYRRISAAHVVAEVSTTSPTPWFAPALSQELVTADPGTRDAVMQTVQACVPDATLVPLGVARLHLSARNGQDTEYVVVDARERRSDDETCCYDVDVFDPAGTVVERWEGLTFRTVRTGERHGPWVPALLGPYIERTVRQVFGGHPAVVVEPDPTPWIPGADLDQRGTADLAASRAFGHPVRLRYGPDGQPDMVGASVSLARDAGLTLLVAGRGRLGCHVGTALGRTPADWADLLGDHVVVRDRLTAASGESAAAAGARVLAALVALRKSGVPPTGALTVDLDQPDGWVLLGTAVATVATWVTNVAGRPDPVVFAVLSGTRR